MKWIWNVGMYVVTWGNQYDEWQYDESMIQKACEFLYPLMTDHDVVGFIKCFKGGITEKPTILNMVKIRSMFGTT